MIDFGLSYVYALLNNGVVFYVGKTNDIHKRYLAHFSDIQCRNYIQHMRLRNDIPELKILHRSYNRYNTHDAEIEKTFIIYFSSMGNKLCNSVYNNKTNIYKLESILDMRFPSIKKNIKLEIVNKAIKEYKIHEL